MGAWRYVVLVALLLVLVGNAHSEALRVLYAEPFEPQIEGRGTTLEKIRASNRLRLQAFGRRFDLELLDNSALLRANSMSPTSLGSIGLFKGTVLDAPGSWVRLMLIDGRYEGAFWDGSDLYAIGARAVIEPDLLTPLAASSAASAIYRLSDTQNGLFQGTCATMQESMAGTRPVERYRGLVRELRNAFAGKPTATQEVSIAFVGDYEFVARVGSHAAMASLINRANIVDGIFSDQVGVSIVPTDFIMYATDTDAFTSGVPSTLLNQVADFKQSRADLASRGIAHLVTGRVLEGQTVGMAFLGSVCEARAGASLSEASLLIDSVLITAHEVGHNLGARHDGESGSACEAQAYLMSPTLSNSGMLSSCSIEVIHSTIAQASCITPLRDRDVEVTVPFETASTLIGQSLDLHADVRAVTAAGAANVSVTAQLGLLQVQSASLAGEACSLDFNVVTCVVPRLAFGETRRLTLRTIAREFRHTTSVTFMVSAMNDLNAANDQREVVVNVTSERDIAISAGPTPVAAIAGEPLDTNIDVSASGVLPLIDVHVTVGMYSRQIVYARVEGGAECMVASDGYVRCPLGQVAAGASRRIEIRSVSSVPGASYHDVTVEDRGVTPIVAGSGRFTIETATARDLAVSFEPLSQRVAVGTESAWDITVRSNGLYAVSNARLQIELDQFTQIDMQYPASCAPAGAFVQCELGTMAPGATVTIPIRVRVDELSEGRSIVARLIHASADDVPRNDVDMGYLDVVVATDVSIDVDHWNYYYDQHPARLNASVRSLGIHDVTNASVRIDLPAGFRITHAAVDSQQCEVDDANANVAVCSSLPVLTYVRSRLFQVDFIAPSTGTFEATVSVAAPGDMDATNNERRQTMTIAPFVDARIAVEEPVTFRLTGVPYDVVFTVTTNRHVTPDAIFSFSWSGTLGDASVSWAGGSCDRVVPSFHRCAMGDLPANSSIPITVRVTPPDQMSYVSFRAEINSSAEANRQDNIAYLSTGFHVPTDLALTVSQTQASGTVGQIVNIADITVSAAGAIHLPYIEIDADPAQVRVNGVYGADCRDGLAARCYLYMYADGEPVHVRFDLIPLAAGAIPIRVRIGAFNDSTPDNNEGSIMLSAQAVPTPSQPPQTGPSSSGGGGGAIDRYLLALLLLVAAMRARCDR